MPEKKKVKILWVTEEPAGYRNPIIQNLEKAGFDVWCYQSTNSALQVIARDPNGFAAVVFDLTVDAPEVLCTEVKKRWPEIHRLCFTPFVKEALQKVPQFKHSKNTRPTLIRRWNQRWTNGEENGGPHAQLTVILKDTPGI